MKWQVVIRSRVQEDVAEAAAWYEARREGLGLEFREEVIVVFDALADNPFLNSRRHPTRNIRWRYPERFPYRVLYEILEEERTVIIAAVLHAARHDRHWHRRV